MTQYWGGGAQNTFSYQFFIILNILGGGGEGCPSPYSAVPEQLCVHSL